MSNSFTQTATFTRSDALHLASRITTELKLVQLLYTGEDPTDGMIEKYFTEVAVLLHNKLLKTVKYGYKKGNEWLFFLEYSANYLGQSTTSGTPGNIPLDANITGGTWYSHLSRHSTGHTAEQLAEINMLIPVDRVTKSEPGYVGGVYAEAKSFERNGVSLDRTAYLVKA